MNPRRTEKKILCGVLLACLASGSWAFAQSLERLPGPRDPERDRVRSQPSGTEVGTAFELSPKQPSSFHTVWTSKAWYQVESSNVAFGEVISGTAVDLPEALVVRVFSERDWSLKLLPDPYLEIPERSEAIPASRLCWRSAKAGSYLPLQGSAPVEIASGSATNGAGELVVVDLQLHLEDTDPLGRYNAQLRLLLETM